MIKVNLDARRGPQDVVHDAFRANGGKLTHVELNRLRWRCRRGMLENDLILTRFLDARGMALTDDELLQLDRLLDLPDGVLWDVLSGRTEAPEPDVSPLVHALRQL